MNSSIEEFVDLLKDNQRKNHVVLLSGNIYDIIMFGSHSFFDAADFILNITGIKFPNALRYDIFSGLSVARGEEDEIAGKMGLSKSSGSQDPLVQALRQSGISRESKFPQNPIEVFLCLDRFFSSDEVKPTIVLVEYANAVVSGSCDNLMQTNRQLSVALTKWARNHEIRKRGHIIVLLCRNPFTLDKEILQRVHEILQIRLLKPDYEARKQIFMGSGVDVANSHILGLASSGLALKELANLKNRSVDDIFNFKKKILSDEYGDLLEVMQAKHGFEAIGGLEKNISELRKVVLYIREGKTELVPQGIRFDGPPGTGKTLIAEALAKEAGLNCVRSKDIKNKFVGESERRMSEFEMALRDLLPVLWFIDEIDQAQISRGSFEGDSGTSRALFKKRLELMSDSTLRGKVLVVMATNRPDLLDPAMKRPGRCDLAMPFLPFSEKELALICKAAFKQFPQMKSGIQDWLPYAKICNGCSGADMIEVVRRAWKHACECDREEIVAEDMEWAIDDYKPRVYDRAEIIRMSLLAVVECTSKSLLPDDWEERAKHWHKELFGNTSGADHNVSKSDLFIGPWTSKALN